MNQKRLMKQKKVLFNLVFIVIVVVLFAATEAGLRLAGYGTSYHIFIEKVFNEKTYLAINPEAGRKYFSKTVKPDVSTDMFLKEKPNDVYRVFVLGGSTSAGYPWEYNLSFSNILKEHLDFYKPNTGIEMVNLSMPAVNSYAVLDLFRQITRYSPDLVIIYTGHNEFYGSMGAGGGGRSVALKRIVLFLRDFRLYQLMENLAKTLFGKSISQDPSNLMHRLAQERLIIPDSPVRKAVHRQYRKNLNGLFRYANRKNIELLIMRPASNLVDYPPFKSAGKFDEQWMEDPIQKAASLIDRGYLKDAKALLEDLLEKDPDFAKMHYMLGKCLIHMDDSLNAFKHFSLARDRDAFPFRMTGSLDTILVRTCAKWSVPLFDTGNELELNSVQAYSNTFCDHLHFSIDGLKRVGESLAEYLLKRPVDLLDDMDHFTRLDSLLGEIRLDILLRTWPYTEDFQVTRPRFIPENAYDRIVMDVWEKTRSWEEGHVYAARLLEQEGRVRDAIREYLALWHLMPYNEAPLVEGARLYIQLEEWKKAISLSEKALEIYYNPRALLYQIQAEAAQAHIGTVLTLMNQYKNEIKRTNPDIRGILYYFEGWAYANKKEYSNALKSLDMALDLLPGYRQAMKLKHDIQTVFQ